MKNTKSGRPWLTNFVNKIILVLFLTPAVANAIVIYDESVQGDASESNRDSLRPVLNLTLGNNIISGTASWLVSVQSPDFDHFSIFLPQESVVTSITYNYLLGTGLEASNNWSLSSNNPQLDGFLGVSEQVRYQDRSSPTDLFSGTGRLPLIANSVGYNFGLSGWSGSDGSQGENIFVDYQVDFKVVPVPEPSALFLLVGGLGAFFAMKIRKIIKTINNQNLLPAVTLWCPVRSL